METNSKQVKTALEEFIKLAVEQNNNNFNIGIFALEKQIPKKIEFTDDGLTYCPVCEYTVRKYCDQTKYCNVCGQRLDFGDE